MRSLYNAAFLALLAASGTLAIPAPAALSSSSSSSTGGFFRAEVKHRLHEEDRLHKRTNGQDDVSFGSYWFCPAVAGGQAVEVLIDTGSADLYVPSCLTPDPLLT